jgi:hypothetical protein
MPQRASVIIVVKLGRKVRLAFKSDRRAILARPVDRTPRGQTTFLETIEKGTNSSKGVDLYGGSR